MTNEGLRCHLCQEDTEAVCASCRLPVCRLDAITTLKHGLVICTRCEGGRIKTYQGVKPTGTGPV